MPERKIDTDFSESLLSNATDRWRSGLLEGGFERLISKLDANLALRVFDVGIMEIENARQIHETFFNTDEMKLFYD